MRSSRRLPALLAAACWSAALAGCATRPSASRIAPYWADWGEDADAEAVLAFRYDERGRARRYPALARRLDYCDSYGLAVNAALGVEEPRERGWLDRLRGLFGAR